MRVKSSLCRQLLLSSLVVAAFTLPGLAQEPDGGDAGTASITDISTYDAFSVAGTAPGVPQGSIFAGFENNEQVQMYNGDLLVSHPSSLSFLVDGGGSFSLTRVYNSMRVIDSQLRDREDPSHVRSFLAGDGWVGYGWLMHFGRVFRRAKENGSICTTLDTQFCDRDFVFEDGVGTQTVFGTKSSVDDQDHSTRRGHPVLRILFFKAPGGDCEKAMQQPTWCDQRPTAAECTAYGNHCDPSSDGTAHYEVTQEDGTVLRLERLVDDDLGYRDYIKNHHRNGWYVTEIRFVNGATVQVTYHYRECRKTDSEATCSARFPFREAIKTVTSSQYSVHAISTTVWASGDAGLITGTVGMLKTVTATGPSAQVATYQFLYELKTESDANGTRQVPLLKEVKLPNVGGQSAGILAYSYQDGIPAASDYSYPGTGPLLQSITYPTGGVSRYGYGSWVCGARKRTPPPNDPPCWNAGQRRCMGVVRRTLLPSGTAGSGQPQADWTWTRRVSARQCCEEEQSVDGTNELSLRGPDGRIQIATTMGSACAPAGAGLIATETTFEGRTTATPLRRDSHSYELKQVKRTDTDYLDDTGQCGDGGHSGTPARMTVDRRRMTNWADWDLTWIKGHYLHGAEDDGDGSGRVVYLEHDDPTTMPSARLAKHVVGRYDTVWVEEDGERREVTYAFDTGATGAGDTGTLHRITVKDEKLVATASLSETSETADWTNDGSDNDDLQSELQYYAYGNLQQVAFRGGDASPDGSRADYTVAYAAWDKAMPTSVKMQGASYNKRKIESDQGAIRYTWDANDTRTAYSYDALGRLTQIAPPTPEWVTRVSYPSLTETRVIQSAGSETTWTPSDPNQLYTEERYDGLGRVVERRRAVPGELRSLQIARYDSVGREIFVSEWMNENEYPTLATGEWKDDLAADTDFDGTTDRSWSYRVTGIPMRNGRPLGRTTFYGTPSTAALDNPLLATPDGLGRVREAHQTDGSVSTMEYCGLRETTRVFGVDANGDGTAGSSEKVTTIHYKDGFGRLVMVDTDAEASDGTGDGADAVYEYDSRGLVTKVTLLSQLPADPFQAWREGTLPGGQERTFQFDAVGRLRQAVNPESGTQGFDRYDVWGNLLAWRDAEASRRGYFFQSTYDSSGRPSKLERRLGTPDQPSSTDWSAITGASRDFEASLGSWDEGSIDPTTQVFSTTTETVWGRGTYGCVPSPPSGGGSHALVLGSGCSYQTASATQWEVVRLFTTGYVHRDSVLTFWYWRNVRESASGTRDAFEVWADLGGDDVSDRRVIFRLDEGDVSYSAMLKSPPIRLADFFSPDDWPDPEGTQPTKMLYIYFAFRKGDAAQTGLGSGIVVDNVTLTRPVRETLSQLDYDQDLCTSATIPAGAACSEGQISDNRELDRITRVRSYENGHVVVDKRLAYKGLTGRLSGVRQLMDWKGLATEGADTQWASVVWRLAYRGDGSTEQVVAPFASASEERRYSYYYDRGLLVKAYAGQTPLLATPQGVPGVLYDGSGSPTEVRFANGAGQTISRDDLSRPAALTVWGPDAPSSYWTSGAYRYDGAGNILGIGTQSFGYDGALRLVRSRVLPQAQSPSTTTDFDVVTNAYDIYGNMTNQTRTPTRDAPSIDFTLNFGGTGASNRNQVVGSMFSYDANGNAVRYTNRVGSQDAEVGSLWDPQNRMVAFVQGEPWSRDSAPGEWYGYDADGFRWKRLSGERDGRVLLTIRDAEGRALAEFGEDPTAGSPRLERDFVYGLGHLLVERRVTNAPPVLGLAAPLYSAGTYHFTVSTDPPAGSYEADISTAAGFRNTVSGLVADANHQIHIPESALATTATNFVRVRVEGDSGTGYSAPVSVVFDPTVTSSSPNQIRSLGVYRNGNDIVLRWALLTENGKKTNVYFRRVDNGTSYLLTPMALASGLRAYTLSSQALSAPCVDFYLKQVLANETGPTPDLRNPSSVAGGQGPGGDGCNDPPPDPSSGPSFENAYHHRDHLGTLRNITNDAGHLIAKFDLYPFGLRMPTGSDGLYASRRVFTGHERDVPTGLDYMLARYLSGSARLLTVDPVVLAKRNSPSPQKWNSFAYVINRPLRMTDPSGETAILVGTTDEKKKALATIKNSVPLELRMYVRTTTTKEGLTIIDPRALNMMRNAMSGNFQALRQIANSPGVARIDASSARAWSRSEGTIPLGREGQAATQGATVPARSSSSGEIETHVGGSLNALGAAQTMAHELRHARRLLLGLPYDHEKQTHSEWRDGALFIDIGLDPSGPVNQETRSAEREAQETYDPFIPPSD
jgi:RHS repeat-associated protein